MASGPAYPFCLPAEHAALSLLPDVREPALRLFVELGIRWHAGVGAGPSNHLLSSQVQCGNALGQAVTDLARLVHALGDLLGVEEVLDVEPGRSLTFEDIGPRDVFGDVPRGVRTRGARCTSVDAAFRHRARDGQVELVLLEWKYTESYRLRQPEPATDAERRRRYADAVEGAAGPVHADVLAFEHLLDEPFYELVRQQLPAHALEVSGDGEADRVRVVHVSPPANDAYRRTLPRPEHRARGATVGEVWQRLLRRPARFSSVDSAVFCDPHVRSPEYVLRYAGDLVRDEAELLRHLGLPDTAALEAWLYAACEHDGQVHCRADEVELQLGRSGRPLTYPFRVPDLVVAVDLHVQDVEEDA